MITHWIDYAPEQMGQDWVLTACQQLVHIREYSSHPTCADKRCQVGAARHRLTLARK